MSGADRGGARVEAVAKDTAAGIAEEVARGAGTGETARRIAERISAARAYRWVGNAFGDEDGRLLAACAAALPPFFRTGARRRPASG